MNRALLIGLIAVVIAALIGGFVVVGGPGYARLEKQDAQRARDLQELFLYLQCQQHDMVLPATLTDSAYCPNHAILTVAKDPETGDPYAYNRVNDTRFEICATFATKAQMGRNGYPYRALHFEGQVGCRKGETRAPK